MIDIRERIDHFFLPKATSGSFFTDLGTWLIVRLLQLPFSALALARLAFNGTRALSMASPLQWTRKVGVGGWEGGTTSDFEAEVLNLR